MPSCGVPLCNSYSSKHVKTEDCKGWHRLPPEGKIREEWLRVIRRENTPDFSNFPPDFRICGLHFSDESFERDLKHELTGAKRTFSLKDDVIPTIFKFKKQPRKRKHSEERASKRSCKDLLSSIMENHENVGVVKSVAAVEDPVCSSSGTFQILDEGSDSCESLDDLDLSILERSELDETFIIGYEEEIMMRR